MKTRTFAAIGAALVVGLGSGLAIDQTPIIRAPHDCTVAFALADRTFIDYENVSTAVVLMSTRGQSEYEGHEANAIQLWDDIDEARAEYRDAKASCLGADS